MADYTNLTSTRTTEPDAAALLNSLRVIDPTIGVGHTIGTNAFTLKKTALWLPADIAAAQQTIDTAPALTPQRAAQNEIDNWSISLRAFALLVLDQINTIRALLPVPLPAITPNQLLNAIRNKAALLS